MKRPTLKIQLWICLIIGVCGNIYGQQTLDKTKTLDNQTPCDTLFIKGGIFSIVSIKQIENEQLFYTKCSNGSTVKEKRVFRINVSEVDSVVRGMGNVLYPSQKIKMRKSFYFEGLVSFNPPFANRLTAQKRVGYAFGLGGSLSAGYQFNPYLGLGVALKSDLLIDYSSASVNSILAEYRLDFGAIKVGLNGGLVTNASFNGEECTSILNKTQPRSAWAVSLKYCSKHYFTCGLNVAYSKVPMNTQCTKISTREDWDFVAFNFLIGFSLPSRLPKIKF